MQLLYHCRYLAKLVIIAAHKIFSCVGLLIILLPWQPSWHLCFLWEPRCYTSCLARMLSGRIFHIQVYLNSSSCLRLWCFHLQGFILKFWVETMGNHNSLYWFGSLWDFLTNNLREISHTSYGQFLDIYVSWGKYYYFKWNNLI